MKVIIGIDVGGSTTKIVGFHRSGELIEPMFVKANDPITSIYGAFGKFTDENHLELKNIDKVMVTGVGSSYITKPLYGLECKHVSEFDCIGLGGLYLSKLEKAIVVSMGTGTALVKAEQGKAVEYLGGTGIGGGTLTGLARKMLGVTDIQNIVELASLGNISNVDLRICDITRKDLPGMSSELTAANFGNLSDLATKNDLALGLVNMIFESVAMLALFASRDKKIEKIVMTGNMTTIPQAKTIFDSLNKNFDVEYIVPDNSQFATVIGAALSELK
ncbi:MAG: type II pantothenate kinase [Clostridia bacterium]|nr:type II pantothenate kinase [Clostridia bacterium]